MCGIHCHLHARSFFPIPTNKNPIATRNIFIATSYTASHIPLATTLRLYMAIHLKPPTKRFPKRFGTKKTAFHFANKKNIVTLHRFSEELKSRNNSVGRVTHS